MKANLIATLVAALALFAAANARAVIFTNLYSFSPISLNNPSAAGTNGGYYPQSDLLLSGSSTFYGTTAYGSTNNDGTIYKYYPGNFVSLHSFSGSDGANPVSDLVLSGSTLFGTTAKGGAYGGGTVFAMNTNGTGFTTLFNFAFTNGGNPQAGLALSGNVLYGVTAYGGAYGAGTIFSINTNGTGFTTFYNFNYTNGANPEADLLLLGNTLYGSAVNGGSNGLGTLFAINTDGSGFTNLLDFNGTNGANPQGTLALASPFLCGTTVNGGTNHVGTIFVIATNGTSFNVVHTFPASGSGTLDGQNPYGRLFVGSNSISPYTLYGTTQSASGSPSAGVLFALNVSGTNLTNTSYSYSSIPGQSMAGVVLTTNGGTYGTVTVGNSAGFGGDLFYIANPGAPSALVHIFGYSQSAFFSTNADGSDSMAGLILSGRTLYGTAYQGGTNDLGTIFAVNTDGSDFTTLCCLGGLDANPWASLILSGNTLYGTATGFGANGPGAVFSINTDGTGFSNLCNFPGSPFGMSAPEGSLLLSSNTLYGTTTIGGDNFGGSVFAVDTDGTDFTNLLSFGFPTPALGVVPQCGLVLSGNILYGTTETGNTNPGVIFAVNTDGTGATNIFNFNGFDGNEPAGTLVLCGNTLYGVTRSDNIRNCGTIFAVNTDGTGFTNLYTFNGYDGRQPQANLILCGNTLYGTTTVGGSGGYGTVFSIHTDGSGFTTLYNFSGGNDGATPYDGLLLSGNTLYGTTSSGGSGGNGTVFALSLGPIPLCIQPAGTNVVLTWGNPAFILLAAPTITGTYTNMPGATSPYTNAITASQQFFRLQVP